MTDTAQSSSAALRAGFAHLTPRERQLFDHLHRSLGRWLDRKVDVYDRVFGNYFSDGTPKTHLSHLRKKLVGTPYTLESGYGCLRLVRND